MSGAASAHWPIAFEATGLGHAAADSGHGGDIAIVRRIVGVVAVSVTHRLALGGSGRRSRGRSSSSDCRAPDR
jgi:hypothetical protein